MAAFYSSIANVYEDIFPVGESQKQLLLDLAGINPVKVLDIACGTGAYANELSLKGHKVTAIDLDEEMIHLANERYPNVDARVLSMLDIKDLGDNQFDFIYSIGNSIVHLKDEAEIEYLIKSIYECLKPGGKICFQIVNYERILEQGITELPLIENDRVKFERYYTLGDQIDFKTILTTPDTTIENKVVLYPLLAGPLHDIIEVAGFNDVMLYGNFKQEAFNPKESFPVVLTALK